MPRRRRHHDTIAGGAGSYVLGNRLGIGGMGVVYAGVCPAAGTHVAVKFLHPDRKDDLLARRRFLDEAAAASVIDHPNVVAILDHGITAGGEPFLVMEHVEGVPLGSYLARHGGVTPARAVAIVRQILAAIGSVHGVGIIHADLKSDNVLLARHGGRDLAKLIDFGLARVQFSSADRAPLGADEEWLSGTPEYMAPELIRGEGPSFATDLYSIGVILYELLTGQTPFAGGTQAEIVRRHLEDEVVPPSLRCGDAELPSALEDVVLRALAKDPRTRYGTATSFDAALASVQALAERARGSSARGVRVQRRTRDDSPTLAWPRRAAHTH